MKDLKVDTNGQNLMKSMKKEKSAVGKVAICAFVLLMLGLIFGGVVPVAVATTWTVDDSGGADFTSIQDAVNNASAGDTIIVRDGTYTENVNVNTTHLTIRSENGAEATIVQAANSNDHIFEVTTDYVNISGFTVERATDRYKAGIYIYYADHCNISNSNCSNNYDGISLDHSTYNIISNNSCSDNQRDGIYFRNSGGHTIISNNNFSNNGNGITLYFSWATIISNNNFSSNNHEGIFLWRAFLNSISNNSFTNNDIGLELWSNAESNNILNNNFTNNGIGISLKSSSNNILRGNILVENGIYIEGGLRHYTQEIDESNTVNGKPVYYWKDVEGETIPEGAGQVILVNCNDVVVENQDLRKASVGIQIAFSSFITINNNDCSNNERYGICLQGSNNNSISNSNCSNSGHCIQLSSSNDNSILNNNCSSSGLCIYVDFSNNNIISNNTCSNNWKGICLGYSKDSVIYLNNFINNTDNVYSGLSTDNIWNSTEEITYTYNGNTYTNYLGNYWDDYTDVDTNNDGIWDNPYSIDGDNDNYPLVEPFENYIGPPPTDTTPPDTEIISGPSGNINYDDATFLWTGSDNVTPTSELVYSYYLQGYDIDWSDGTSDTSKTYNDLSYGDYIFKVKAKDQAGNVDPTPAETDFTISPNQPPIASFTHSPENPKAGEEVTFDASDSEDPDGEIVLYEWDWDGDGDYDGYADSPTKTTWWMEDGEYTVRLRVTDDQDRVATFNRQISIDESPTSRRNGILTRLFGWVAPWSQEHKKFKEIDEWLRQEYIAQYPYFRVLPGSKPLGWLKDTDFEWCEEVDIIYVLNKEVNSDEVGVSGITYRGYALGCVRDEKLVDRAFYSPTPRYECVMRPLIKYVVSEDEPFWIAVGIIGEALSPHLKLAVNVILLSKDVAPLQGVFKEINDVAYGQALGKYFMYMYIHNNENTAWEEAAKLVNLSIPSSANDEQRDEVLSATRSYFQRLWEDYKGYGVFTYGLKREFREQARDEIRDILISALNKHKNELPNREKIQLKSPGELRVYDSQGNVAGLIQGQVREEIPNSVFDEEKGEIVIFDPSDSYRYEISGTDEGSYGLDITSVEDGEAATFTATDIPTSVKAIHQYTIDWDALSQGEEGVTVQVDSDGDGTFEDTFSANNELSRDEFLSATKGIYVESSDILGDMKDIFAPGESVYAIGSGYVASTTYNLYVVNDTTWTDGVTIPTRVSGTETTVTTVELGKIAAGTLIWASAAIGKYDLVVDVNENGAYDEDIDPIDDMDVNDAGFETVPEFTTITIPVAIVLGLVFLFSRRKRKQ